MRTSLFVPRSSFLHSLDPRTKLLALAIACTGLLLFDDPLLLLWPALGLLVASALGRVFRRFLAGFLVLGAFGMLAFLLWPLFLTLRGQGGPAAWIYGAGIGMRLTEILLAGFLLMLTTGNEEVLAALARMGLPFPIVFSFGLTFRLLPSLLVTAGHVVEAQRLRGLKFDEGGLVTRARRYVPLLVPILACSLRTARQMSWALEAKGFGPSTRPEEPDSLRAGSAGSSSGRVPYIALRMRARDWAVLAGAAALLGVAVWARFHGIGIVAAAHVF